MPAGGAWQRARDQDRARALDEAGREGGAVVSAKSKGRSSPGRYRGDYTVTVRDPDGNHVHTTTAKEATDLPLGSDLDNLIEIAESK